MLLQMSNEVELTCSARDPDGVICVLCIVDSTDKLAAVRVSESAKIATSWANLAICHSLKPVLTPKSSS